MSLLALTWAARNRVPWNDCNGIVSCYPVFVTRRIDALRRNVYAVCHFGDGALGDGANQRSAKETASSNTNEFGSSWSLANVAFDGYWSRVIEFGDSAVCGWKSNVADNGLGRWCHDDHHGYSSDSRNLFLENACQTFEIVPALDSRDR